MEKEISFLKNNKDRIIELWIFYWDQYQLWFIGQFYDRCYNKTYWETWRPKYKIKMIGNKSRLLWFHQRDNNHFHFFQNKISKLFVIWCVRVSIDQFSLSVSWFEPDLKTHFVRHSSPQLDVFPCIRCVRAKFANYRKYKRCPDSIWSAIRWLAIELRVRTPDTIDRTASLRFGRCWSIALDHSY